MKIKYSPILIATAFAGTSHAFTPFASTPIGHTHIIATPKSTSLRHATVSTATVEFPSQPNKVQRVKRAAQFWFTAFPIVVSYYAKAAELRVQETITGHRLTVEEEQNIWNKQHSNGARKLSDTIMDMQGFYVKAAQIVGTRRDLFPREYIDALSAFTDNVDPLPIDVVKAVIEKELLDDGEVFEDIFAEFDTEPLGSASIAQVHRATLVNGKEVAVKVQRPSIESKLMGDIANLLQISKTFRDDLPVDYYAVFSELEKQLKLEFNFVFEADAMIRFQGILDKNSDGSLPVVVPSPVAGLVSERVLVMDYLKGMPLSRATKEMSKKGITADSPEAQLFGKKVVKALTKVFGITIFEGFFHADPHPGNLFLLDDGRIGLIDFGQVKQIDEDYRKALANVVVALTDRQSDDNSEDLKRIGDAAQKLGIELKPSAPSEGSAAVAMWLFDGKVEKLPGGYDSGELSPNSPVKAMKSFPQDLVLLGRSSILVKALSNKFGIPWSLAQEWAPYARRVLGDKDAATVPTGKKSEGKIRSIARKVRVLGKNKLASVFLRLPSPVRAKAASVALYLQREK